MQDRTRDVKRWNDADTLTLERMVYEGKSWKEMAAKLQRTIRQIRDRISDCGLGGLCGRHAREIDRRAKIWAFGDEITCTAIAKMLQLNKGVVSRYRRQKPKDW